MISDTFQANNWFCMQTAATCLVQTLSVMKKRTPYRHTLKEMDKCHREPVQSYHLQAHVSGADSVSGHTCLHVT